MQTPKGRIASSEVPQKVSPRVIRQLKTTGLDSDSASASSQGRTPKDKSPKVGERRSPRSPVTEKKRPSKISELESQVSLLQEELRTAKDQLSASESWKKQALEDAEESKKQLSAMSSELEESQKQLLQIFVGEEEGTGLNETILEEKDKEKDKAWQFQLDAAYQQHSVDKAALSSALSEIQRLKVQLEAATDSKAAPNKLAESTDVELRTLKGKLMHAISLVENMKSQLGDSKGSEVQARALASEALVQLETAKKSVKALRSDGIKSVEAYNGLVAELEQSRVRVNLLEELVSKLKDDLQNTSSNKSHESVESEKPEEADLRVEICSLKDEVGRLQSALEESEARFREDQVKSSMQIRSAHELMEQMKSGSGHREAELEAELKEAKALVEELKADLMDKETELQGISEENEGLNLKLDKNLSSQRESELQNELKKLKESVTNLQTTLIDKETELQGVLEENDTLKFQFRKMESERGRLKDNVAVELEQTRASEKEALLKVGLVMEEASKSSKKVARVTEQLEAAQAANSEMEAELRRLKVQSDQWRKAAEAAAAMLSVGNNGKFMDRTASLDSHYSPVGGKLSPFNDDMDDDMKKKNGSMLKKIGILWKKPQK